VTRSFELYAVDGLLTDERVNVGRLNSVRRMLEIARECRTVLGAFHWSKAPICMRRTSRAC